MKRTNKSGDKGSELLQEPAAVVLKELEVRVARPEERDRVRQLLGEEHYLGAGREVGRTLVQVVHHREQWVAVLVWGPAAMKLVDREQWIGWTDHQRAQRLGLVVQNRRFLVLSATRMPNLATRALGLAVRALPEQWEQKHGYKPVLAEPSPAGPGEMACVSTQPAGRVRRAADAANVHRHREFRGDVLQGQRVGALRDEQRVRARAPGGLLSRT